MFKLIIFSVNNTTQITPWNSNCNAKGILCWVGLNEKKSRFFVRILSVLWENNHIYGKCSPEVSTAKRIVAFSTNISPKFPIDFRRALYDGKKFSTEIRQDRAISWNSPGYAKGSRRTQIFRWWNCRETGSLENFWENFPISEGILSRNLQFSRSENLLGTSTNINRRQPQHRRCHVIIS